MYNNIFIFIGVYICGAYFYHDKSLGEDWYSPNLYPQPILPLKFQPRLSNWLSSDLDNPITPQYVQMELQIFFPTPGYTWIFPIAIYNDAIHKLKPEIKWPSLTLHFPLFLFSNPLTSNINSISKICIHCLHLYSHCLGSGHCHLLPNLLLLFLIVLVLSF